jgi:hypothetical protein
LDPNACVTFGPSRLSLNNSHISWCVGAHSLTLIWWCIYVGGHSLTVIVRPSVMDAPPLLFLRIIPTNISQRREEEEAPPTTTVGIPPSRTHMKVTQGATTDRKSHTHYTDKISLIHL